MSNENREALRDVRSNKDLVILSADKANTAVIMATIENNRTVEELLDPDFYNQNENPTTRIERRSTQLVKETDWSPEAMKRLQSTENRPF